MSYTLLYSHKNQVDEKNYFAGVFIDDDDEVDRFVNGVQSNKCTLEVCNYSLASYFCLSFTLQNSTRCGETHWKAAKCRSRSMKHQAETGLAMICCRHAMLLKGINMMQGEIFAYPLYLHMKIAEKHKLTFICQDVACRYWPWLKKLSTQLPSNSPMQIAMQQRPFLSLMHGKAHNWDCQVGVLSCCYQKTC